MSKKSVASVTSSKSDDSSPEVGECEEVQLRSKPNKPVLAERSSVNQCINELSSNLVAEAARRRCNSEVVQRTENIQDTNGMFLTF